MGEVRIVPADISRPISADMAEVLWEAFREKKRALRIGRKVSGEFIRSAVNARACLVALVDGDLAGVIGFSTVSLRFLYLRFPAARKKLGVVPSAVVYLTANVFARHRPRPDELAIEALAIMDAVRGKGIGTALLMAAEQYARRNGFCRLTLEVVDTNAAARRLYEKIGFRPAKTRRFGILTRRAGFSAATRMEKRL